MGMPSRRLVGVLVLVSCASLAACGGSEFDVSSGADATDDTSDGASSDTSAADAPSDASPVDTSAPPADVDTGTTPDAPKCNPEKECCSAPGAPAGKCCEDPALVSRARCVEWAADAGLKIDARTYVCATGTAPSSPKCHLIQPGPKADVWCCDAS